VGFCLQGRRALQMGEIMRRTLGAGVLAAVALFVAPGVFEPVGIAAQTSSSEAPQPGGDLIFAQIDTPPSLEPAETYVNQAIWDELLIMEPLFTPSADGQTFEPWLAESYEISPDNLSWTITLREGVTFSNGDPVTAADVKFSLEQAAASDAWGFINVPIAEGTIEVQDDRTLVITTTFPWAALGASLALFANAILPEDYNGMPKEEFFANPIGTGPFMIDEWDQGTSLRLVRNPNYWQDGKPYLDSVTFVSVPDDNARLNMLRGGQAHVIEAPPFAVLEALDAEPGIVAEAFQSSKTDLLYLNTRQAPFEDQNIRQAIAHAIDRQAIVDAVLFGEGEVANSFISPAIPGYNPDNVAPAYDPERARELLAESSQPDGFETTLKVPSSADARIMSQIIQSNLADIGIDAEIVSQDPGATFGDLSSFNYDMLAFAWTTDIPDADELITGYKDVEGQWTGLVSAPDAIDQARLTFDETARNELFAEVQQEVANDSSVIALFYSNYPYAYSDAVHGFEVLPSLNYHLEDVWLTE
jgi:peptide/nickel transport system substrate-binding protein